MSSQDLLGSLIRLFVSCRISSKSYTHLNTVPFLIQLPRTCKISYATCGAVTHFLLTPDDDGGVMTVCFGQGASNGIQNSFTLSSFDTHASFCTGELGLGVDEPKSATKPTKNVPLAGIEVFK